MLNSIKIDQKIKSYFHNESFVSGSIFDGDPDVKLPEGVFILDLTSEWVCPTYSKRKEILKNIEIFDPVKIELSTNFINYKFIYITNFLKSWKIRGPNINESGDSSSIDSLPSDIVDAMYAGIEEKIREAEDVLGKV